MVSFILPGNSATGGYEVDNSLRFEDGSSDSLSRTPSSSGNRKTWTWSGWIKRSELGRTQNFFSAGTNNQNYGRIQFNSDDTIYIAHVDSASTTTEKSTTQKFRDTSAWYHIVWHIDTTQSTASDREKLYINGAQVTSFSTNTIPAEDYQSTINEDVAHYIGTQLGSYEKCSCYFAEVVFIDGQALTPTSFGEFDSDSPNIWKPISVSGLTFGTNGFYLQFKQSGTSQNSSGLGADTSGNDHHFAVSNLTAVDQCTDTCTNNFATFNGALGYNSTIVLAEGNIKGTTGSTHEALYGSIFSSIGVTQGKWYAEFKVTTNSDKSIIGISADLESDADGSSGSAFNFIYLGQGIGYYGNNGKIFHTDSNTQMTYGSSLSNNDIVGIALDVDNQEVYFSVNGTFQNSGNPASGSSKTGGVVNEGARNIFSTGTGTIFFAVADFDRDATCAIEANFGGGSVSSISSGNSDANGYGNFEYSVPSGYYSLCTKNLAEYG